MVQSKNAIIVVGNGFDLAHGLETAYNDFALYYLNEVIINRLIENPYNSIFSENLQVAYEKENKGEVLNLSRETTSLVKALANNRERKNRRLTKTSRGYAIYP